MSTLLIVIGLGLLLVAWQLTMARLDEADRARELLAERVADQLRHGEWRQIYHGEWEVTAANYTLRLADYGLAWTWQLYWRDSFLDSGVATDRAAAARAGRARAAAHAWSAGADRDLVAPPEVTP